MNETENIRIFMESKTFTNPIWKYSSTYTCLHQNTPTISLLMIMITAIFPYMESIDTVRVDVSSERESIHPQFGYIFAI